MSQTQRELDTNKDVDVDVALHGWGGEEMHNGREQLPVFLQVKL